jgi:glycosyltransferase involved in cell wall biosynthesis
MKILVLWSKPSGYLLSQLKSLYELGIEVHLFVHSNENEAPFEFQTSFPYLSSFEFVDQINEKTLSRMVGEINPNAILICSWNNSAYLRIARHFPVIRILFMDNQWKKTLKQLSGVFLRRIIIQPHFDGVLLPGARQEVFAKFLGFKPTQIANMGYSADVDRFLKVNPSPLNRNFLFVGRLVKEKGLDDLLDGYESYRNARKDPWGLRIVGNGKLKQRILQRSISGVSMADFIQPSLLPYEYAGSSCFILPSKFEPWGLVLHEAAASGLPIISSDACGSSDEFVEEGVNGFIFKSGKVLELTNAMIQVHDMSVVEWGEMSMSSRTKAQLITPKTWATSIVNLISDIQKSKLSQ